jgi:hypothetical protein
MLITPRFQGYAPEMEKHLHSWHMDETYIKVNGLIYIVQLQALYPLNRDILQLI